MHRAVLLRLGWPLLCERFAEHLRKLMAQSPQRELAAALARPVGSDGEP